MKHIPRILASKVSQVIFVILFIYLFGFGVLGLVFKSFEPSSQIQLVFGNYTNVLSALGAAIAAGAGVTAVKEGREHHRKVERHLKIKK